MNSEMVGRVILSRQEFLAGVLSRRQFAAQAGKWEELNPAVVQKSQRDAGYHLAFLAEALINDDPAIFIHYAAWVKVLFAGLKFHPDSAYASLQVMSQVLSEELTPDQYALADAVIQAALLALDDAPADPPVFLNDSLPMAGLARDYLEALLNADRQLASRLILDAVARGVKIKDIYLHVFQRVQYEIGRLWQTNRISVAQEHYCTAATQMIISQLYPHIFSTTRVNRRLVATCVGGELHELGMRMVTDFFEMEGWDTYYLGANTPTPAIIAALVQQRAHVLAVSVTLTLNIQEAASLIAAVRAEPACDGVRILVGGYPFNISPDLWETIGADGCGADAQQAVETANRLVSK